MPLAPFNSLPPRPEYIEKVITCLTKEDLQLAGLISKTKLTRTQVACTLDSLIAKKKVSEYYSSDKRKVFQLVESD